MTNSFVIMGKKRVHIVCLTTNKKIWGNLSCCGQYVFWDDGEFTRIEKLFPRKQETTKPKKPQNQ